MSILKRAVKAMAVVGVMAAALAPGSSSALPPDAVIVTYYSETGEEVGGSFTLCNGERGTWGEQTPYFTTDTRSCNIRPWPVFSGS
ncbi:MULTISPECIES: DUF6289 family protein [Caulobacter]|nr:MULTISPECIES: DUF6289 family protein [Caulobacter]MBQ1559916.1 hypothetical protein [Caulobacter sp.]